MTAPVYSSSTMDICGVPSRRTFLAGAGAALSANLFPAAVRAQPAPLLSLKRGGSIHSLLNWPELEPGSKDKFVWPPFASPKYQISPRLLSTFKQAGLDFIRLTVDPGIFLASEKTRRDELDAILLNRCHLILAAGLNVIVDFHPISQVAAWTPVRIVTEPNVFEAYTALMGRTASVLAALDPAHVALEFMNEPPYGYDASSTERWRRMLQAMYKAARAANPRLALVLGGAAGGGSRGLFEIDARQFADPNIFWSFHFYDPHPFTHQGVVTSQSNMLHYRYLTDLPYPVDAGEIDSTLLSVRQAILADKSLPIMQRVAVESAAADAVKKYFASKFGVRDIAAEFDKVELWAKANNVDPAKILLGEFGTARRSVHGNGALNRHRETWLRDVRLQAEKRKFAWAIWDMDDNQMGLVTQRGSGLLDTSLLRALGLNESAG